MKAASPGPNKRSLLREQKGSELAEKLVLICVGVLALIVGVGKFSGVLKSVFGKAGATLGTATNDGTLTDLPKLDDVRVLSAASQSGGANIPTYEDQVIHPEKASGSRLSFAKDALAYFLTGILWTAHKVVDPNNDGMDPFTRAGKQLDERLNGTKQSSGGEAAVVPNKANPQGEGAKPSSWAQKALPYMLTGIFGTSHKVVDPDNTGMDPFTRSAKAIDERVNGTKNSAMITSTVDKMLHDADINHPGNDLYNKQGELIQANVEGGDSPGPHHGAKRLVEAIKKYPQSVQEDLVKALLHRSQAVAPNAKHPAVAFTDQASVDTMNAFAKSLGLAPTFTVAPATRPNNDSIRRRPHTEGG